ncbi:BTB/POZ domain-containing protein kctd15-like [Gigantopelta aegis]|uniref:BTB/POZ domain-containing protein kctd15-like n=1 Tax=Gigantopelta aegis TaxID=1735272 RepID=UPI001B88997A|nr:BTB/POZ domain-containing protein kctd15-like [Gigantopelta aegis]
MSSPVTSRPSSAVTPNGHFNKISGVPCSATPTRYTAPVHIDVGGTIYTSSLETLTRFSDSKLARMFNGNVPIVLDSLKQHYFIDRDGKMFRYVLNYLRCQRVMLPEQFSDFEQLYEEAKYYELTGMMRDIETIRKNKQNTATSTSSILKTAREIKTEPTSSEFCDCIAVSISPDLGERISLSAERSLIEEVFPELSSALVDTRNSGWNMENHFVIRFPLNGFCKMNSVQVIQRLLNHSFQIIASTGGGVEGQQFSEYLFSRNCRALR